MANNVTITAGVVATDDVAGVHYQVVKLAVGTEDSADRVPGDATFGMDVDVTRLPALPAGANNIGDVDVLTLPALPAGDNNIGNVDIVTMPAIDTELAAAVAASDALANPTTAPVVAHLHHFDGTDWERTRGLEEAVLLATAARTGTSVSADHTNRNHRGMIVILDVDAIGTGNLLVRIETATFVGGNYVELNVEPTAVTAVGNYWFVFYPGSAGGNVSANIRQVVDVPLPRRWRIKVVHSDGSSWTYGVFVVLVP